MRLIDADALIQKRNHAKAYAQDMYVIGQGYVMDAPTIDAVVVVRCGECEAYQPTEGGKPFCVVHQIAVCKNDYCSHGAKMEVEP